MTYMGDAIFMAERIMENMDGLITSPKESGSSPFPPQARGPVTQEEHLMGEEGQKIMFSNSMIHMLI
jgi:hypothetical protein